MPHAALLIVLLLGCVLMGFLALYYHRRYQNQKQHVTELCFENNTLKERLESYDHLKSTLQDNIRLMCQESLETASAKLLKQSQEALTGADKMNQQRLEHQKASLGLMLTPLEKALEQMHSHIRTLEQKRAGAYESLSQQVGSLQKLQHTFQQQTGQLLSALRTPNVRGQWGELQLKRLVEWCGMLPFCDFREQETVPTDTGHIRPDLIIRLPLGRSIVVDAKAPLHGLDSAESENAKTLKESVKHLRTHIQTLNKRGYSRYIKNSPGFVLLFLPTENLLIRALNADPTLMDYCMEKSILLATPMTLIALLKTIALGWHQESLNVNAQKIGRLSKELAAHVQAFLQHFQKMGQSLEKSVKCYNESIDIAQNHLIAKGEEINQLAHSGDSPNLASMKNIPRKYEKLQSA